MKYDYVKYFIIAPKITARTNDTIELKSGTTKLEVISKIDLQK
jgi:hypothetical protein